MAGILSERDTTRRFIYIETESAEELIAKSKGVYSALRCPLEPNRIRMHGPLKRELIIGSWRIDLPRKWIFMTHAQLTE